MPKAFSEHERKIVQESILNVGASLIRKKGIRQMTVEDITKGANIAKGSFYSFYKSREELLWEIIKREEQQLLERIAAVAAQNIDIKLKMNKIFYDLLLQEDCLVFYLPEDDLQYIVRKLPPELVQADTENAQSIIQTLLSLCNLSESQESIEIMMAMIHSLRFIASSEGFHAEKSRSTFLNIIVEAFSDYLSN